MLIMITLEIYGIGFELSLGKIDKSKFEYWKDREISEEDASKKNNELSLFSDHWTDLNDIFHDNGPAMLENTKLEVKENDKIGNTLKKCNLILDHVKKALKKEMLVKLEATFGEDPFEVLNKIGTF